MATSGSSEIAFASEEQGGSRNDVVVNLLQRIGEHRMEEAQRGAPYLLLPGFSAGMPRLQRGHSSGL